MEEKILGKIIKAEYGTVKDYPFLMGLQLDFKLGNGCGIGSGSKYTVNICEECRWEEQERLVAITKSVDDINKILEDAKVNYISQLLNKPVEVIVENHTFKDFRILTEVL